MTVLAWQTAVRNGRCPGFGEWLVACTRSALIGRYCVRCHRLMRAFAVAHPIEAHVMAGASELL